VYDLAGSNKHRLRPDSSIERSKSVGIGPVYSACPRRVMECCIICDNNGSGYGTPYHIDLIDSADGV